ncbi:hypothetical protein IF1G_02877 [Cordyceps javanica]|uniref:Uncharacterized protein n=1 Tax=Cordyceps javanica TaxID=43265 RepID=A0A545VAN6_9HYPO|nr:hypothetical protein IF1G_02877 [Cordyceps javanica]
MPRLNITTLQAHAVLCELATLSITEPRATKKLSVYPEGVFGARRRPPRNTLGSTTLHTGATTDSTQRQIQRHLNVASDVTDACVEILSISTETIVEPGQATRLLLVTSASRLQLPLLKASRSAQGTASFGRRRIKFTTGAYD